MGESVDDHTAREDLRTTFMRLDRVLAGLGWPRPPSATVQEHLRALSVDRLVESETLDAVAGNQALLYSPDAGAPQLQAAVEQVEAVARLLEQWQPASGLSPSATEPERASSPIADASASSEDLLDSFDGPNPQLTKGAPGKSSPGLHWTATLSIGGAIVVVATCIALWKPGIGRRRWAESQEDGPAGTDPVAYYTSLISKKPRHLEAHRWLADHYRGLREYALAMYHYEWVIKLSPESPHSLNNLAWILLTARKKQLRDPPRALKLAKRAVRESRGRDAYIVDTLAVAYFQNGQKDKAITTLKAAPVSGPDPAIRQLYRRRKEKFIKEDPPGNWDEEE